VLDVGLGFAQQPLSQLVVDLAYTLPEFLRRDLAEISGFFAVLDFEKQAICELLGMVLDQTHQAICEHHGCLLETA
jgi:hypothetical protein